MNRIYGAYGSSGSSGRARSAYAGQRIETDTGWYLLGERLYSPTLRRFLAPDPLSPFRRGGFHRYAYCGGDPVNRVDPSGRIFAHWFRRPAGPAGAPGQGNLRLPDLPSSVDTPTSAVVTAAPIENALTLTSAIASRTGYATESAAFGLLADGSGPGRAPPKHLNPVMQPDSLGHVYFGKAEHANIAAKTWRRRPGRGRVRIVSSEGIPPDRLKYSQDGSPPTLIENWVGHRHHRNPDSTIWAPDTSIDAFSLHPLFKRLAAVGVTKATIYTSAHGNPHGKNWTPFGGYRLLSAPEFFHEDFTRTANAARSVGIDIDLIPMTLVRLDDMRRELLVSRVNIVACCYGLADQAVVEAINQDVTVYLDPLP